MKFKNIFLILLICTISVKLSQSQTWTWAVGEGGKGMERPWNIAMDEEGNVLACGQFTDTLIVENNIIPSKGISDIFVVKYESNGRLDWVSAIGGKGEDVAMCIDTDSLGNSYISGYFTDTMFVNQDTLIAIAWDLFLIKLNEDGQVLWSSHPKGNGSEIGYGLACSPSGNVYITGWYQDTIKINDSILLPSFGSSDIAVLKYNNAGENLWAKHAGREFVEYGYRIDIDEQENCYITGVCSDSSIFDTALLVKGGMFLAKYDAQGVFIAANSASGGVGSNHISVSPNGTGYITGRFTGYGIFNGLTDTVYTYNATDDSYLLQFNSNCVWQWVNHNIGSGSDKGRSVYADLLGNAYYTGSFNDSITIGDSLLLAQNDDIFVAKVNSSGNYEWIQQGGSINSDISTDIISDNQNLALITGWYQGVSQFGSHFLNASNAADINFYIAAIDESLSIKEMNSENLNSYVYPNPVFNKGFIRLNNTTSFKTGSLRIVTTLGTLVLQKDIQFENNKPIEFNVSGLTNGLYFYSVQGANEKISGKFLIINE